MCVLRPWAWWRAVVFHSVMSLAGVWQLLAAVYILWLSGVKLPVFVLKFMGFQSNANGCLNYVTEVAYVPMVAEIGCYAVHG